MVNAQQSNGGTERCGLDGERVGSSLGISHFPQGEEGGSNNNENNGQRALNNWRLVLQR